MRGISMYRLAIFVILSLFITLVVGGCELFQEAPLRPGELFREDFNRLDSSKWWATKGSSRTQDGWLVLTSAPQHGAEVQQLQLFRYRSLEFRASSDYWNVDTSIGFEVWWHAVHQAIVVTNGHLGIINQSKRQKPNEWYGSIPDWDLIKSQANIFKIVWSPREVELLINGKATLVYRGDLIPEIDMNARINSSNDFTDKIKVDYVSIMK